MKISGQQIIACLTPVLLALGIISSASAQITTYRATTETQDLAWNRSTRIEQTRVEANGRTVETRVVEAPSINGGYTVVSTTEKETIRDGADNIRVVERCYAPDVNGRRQLAWTSEAETTVSPGEGKTTIRTTYDTDVNGNLQVTQREIERSTSMDASTDQTASTVFRRQVGGLVPVQQTVTAEARKQSGVTDVQSTASFPDPTGKLIATQVTHAVVQRASDGGLTTVEERDAADPSGVPGEDRMAPVQRTVTQEWKDSGGQHSRTETSTAFLLGVAPDGQLHLDRQVVTVQQTAVNGDRQVLQQTAAINPGAKTDPPHPTEVIIEISRGANGDFETQKIVEVPNSSGVMKPFHVSVTRESTR